MSDYKQQNTVIRMHSVPRFGHTSSISSLASSDIADTEDYKDGILSFSIFLICLFAVWSLVLIVLKLYCGKERVGCAAAGGRVDVAELRKQKVSRRQRKRRIQRSWRLQFVFLIASIAIPVMSFLLLNRGFRPFLKSTEEIAYINDDIDSRAVRGIEIANSLTKLYQQMKKIDLDQNFCPNYSTSQLISGLGLQSVKERLEQGVADVDIFMNDYFDGIQKGLYEVTDATEAVQEAVETTFDYDWLVKFFLLGLNVVNVFLFFGVLLARNGVDYAPYQTLLTYVFVPAFAVFIIGSIVGTCGSLIAATMNSDFCAGGPSPGSPQGTLKDVIQQHGFNESSLAYEALDYYTQNCLSENPLAFVADLHTKVENSEIFLDQLLDSLNKYNATQLSIECGEDIQSVNATLSELSQTLTSVAEKLQATADLIDCSKISPLAQRLFNGVTCNDSVEGLTWLFSTLLVITVLGMTMLSTRAALYNPVIPAKHKRRREREFEDYKKFMSDYYDTSDWKLDPDKVDGDEDLPRVETFETEETDETSRESPLSSSDRGSEPFESQDVEEAQAETPAAYTSAMAARADAEDRVISGADWQEDEDDDSSYYSSSSSDSDDSIGRSFISVTSAISGLVDRFFNIRRTHLEHTDENSLAAISFDVNSMSSSGWKEDEPQSDFETPHRHEISILGPLEDPLGPRDFRDSFDDETKPLSPPMLKSTGMKAPQKSFRSLSRTTGGSKMMD